MKKLFSNCHFILFSLFFLCIWCEQGRSQGWPDQKIRLLPDDSFAVTEVRKNGSKIRHCPYRDLKGNLDENQLIYVLGTFEKETWLDPGNKKIARKHLEKHYNTFIKDVREKGLHDPVNINKAKLADLVALPRIGPVLAVKIVQYREKHGSFDSVEDIKKVTGIGQETFNGIRYYISTD